MNGDDERSSTGVTADALTREDQALIERYRQTFIGSYSHTLDSKGRMVVPQAFREQLGASFCIAPSQDFRSISLYATLAWARLRDRYARLGSLDSRLRRFLEQFDALSYRDQECDAQGRILLPARIRQQILGDEKDVEITGASDHVRVVAAGANAEQYAAFLEDLPGILEHIDSLGSTLAE